MEIYNLITISFCCNDIKNINNGNLMNDWPGKRKHRRKHERLSERHKRRYKKGGGVR